MSIDYQCIRIFQQAQKAPDQKSEICIKNHRRRFFVGVIIRRSLDFNISLAHYVFPENEEECSRSLQRNPESLRT